jgi:hypothetical protein
MPVRDVFKLVYKIGTIAVTLVLIGLAYLAYREATPGNGLLLITGILGMLALITGLSISKLDDQDERLATYRGIFDQLRKGTKVSVQFAEPEARDVVPAMPDGVRTIADMNVSFAEPEVHHVDNGLLATAKRMAEDGSPIDDICRAIDRDHDSHDPIHQEAFRRIVHAMLEKG